MAINERVGILTHVPGDSRVTPGLIGGIYVDWLTKELDFLDDLRVSPSIESFTAPYSGELDTLYRQWRDERFVKEVNYWNARKNREPFTYQNFVIDPSADGSNAFEWIRTVTPSPNGDFNVPYPNPVGSTQSLFYNSERPLKHLYLRVNLPVEDMGFSCAYASGCNYWLESTSQVRDNQAAIDAKQAEIDTVLATRLPIAEELMLKFDELQVLISSGVDQSLIDAKQAEVDLLNSQNDTFDAQLEILNQNFTDLENASNWVSPNTMEKMNTDFRANRDAYLKAMNELALGTPLSEQYGMVLGVYKESLTEEDLAAMRQAYLDFDAAETNPNPWSDERFRFAWGDGQNPVEGAPNGTIHNMIGWGQGSNDLTNHPLGTMPFEVLPGVTSLNRLPAVSNISLLMGATGSAGDIVMVDGEDFAWDPQNEEWSRGFYLRFLSPFTGHFQAMVDAKLKAVNENILATRPFLYASLYVPVGNVFSETGPKSPKTGVITIDTEPPTCPMDPIWDRDLYEAWKCALDPAFPNCDFSKY